MSSGVFGHPWLGGLFSDTAVTAILSAEAELARMLRIEAAWTRALGQCGAGDAEVCDALADKIMSASISPGDLAEGTARDGVVVPALVQILKGAAEPAHHHLIHKGLTSQDVIDTSLMLALAEILPVLSERLEAVTDATATLAQRHGERTLMGHTRMQPALPVTVGHRIAGWRRSLTTLQSRLTELADRAAIVQWGGPVGLRDNAPDGMGAQFAANLGLRDPGHAWHTDRLIITDIAACLAALSGALGKIGQDIALMAQSGPDAIRLTSGGGSSAMPHKQNPVPAELLVTLARYNAGALGTLHQTMVHEQERSGSAWTLEWMVLPDMIRSTTCSLLTAARLLAEIDTMGQGGS